MVAKLIIVIAFLLLIALVYIYIADYKHVKSMLIERIRSIILQHGNNVSLQNLDEIISDTQKAIIQLPTIISNHEEKLKTIIKENENLKTKNSNLTNEEFTNIKREISNVNVQLKANIAKLTRLTKQKEKLSNKYGVYIYTDCILFSEQFLKAFYNDSVSQTLGDQWLISEGDFINKEQPLFTWIINTRYNYRDVIVKSPLSGFIGIFSAFYSDIDPKEKMVFGLYDDDSVRLEQRYQHVSSVEIDPFTNKRRLYWKQVGLPCDSLKPLYKRDIGLNPDGSSLSSIVEPSFVNVTGYLMFTIENIDSNDYLKIEFLRKELKLSTKDIIFFRFSDNTLLEFKLTGKCYTSSVDGMQGFKVQIYKEEVEIFSKCDIEGIRIYCVKEEYKLDFESASFWYTAQKDFQFVVKTLFSQYLSEVNSHIDNYKPLSYTTIIETNTTEDIKTCHVYLMSDTINNYHKIGISSYPQFREKTLQSEKPTIELICNKEFPSRKIAESIEKALHNSFRDKHIRGEWFSLDQKDIEQIKLTLK